MKKKMANSTIQVATLVKKMYYYYDFPKAKRPLKMALSAILFFGCS